MLAAMLDYGDLIAKQTNVRNVLVILDKRKWHYTILVNLDQKLNIDQITMADGHLEF